MMTGYATSRGPTETTSSSTWGASIKGGSPPPDDTVFVSGGNGRDGGSGHGVGDLERMVQLLTNEDTAQLSERQLVVLKRVLKARQIG